MREKGFVRIFVLAIVSLLILGFLHFYFFPGFWTMTFYKITRPDLVKNMDIKYSERQITHPSFENSTDVSMENVKLKLPWSGLSEEKKNTNVTLWKFPDSKNTALIVSKGEENEGTTALLGKDPDKVEYIRNFFGLKEKSDYYLFKTIYQSNTNEIKFFTPKKEATAKIILLTLKGIIRVETQNREILAFETDNIRGFQSGNPAEFDKITVEFFDNVGKWYTLITDKANQEEIDFILSSIRFEEYFY